MLKYMNLTMCSFCKYNIHSYHPHPSPTFIAHIHRPQLSPTSIAHRYRPQISPTSIAHSYRPRISPTSTAHIHRPHPPPTSIPTSIAYTYRPRPVPTSTAHIYRPHPPPSPIAHLVHSWSLGVEMPIHLPAGATRVTDGAQRSCPLIYREKIQPPPPSPSPSHPIRTSMLSHTYIHICMLQP